MTESLRRNVAQLERTQAQLVQSEKLASIGEMAAAVAHGLRNPLASLRAAAQLVRRHPDSPVVARAPRRHHRGGGPARPPHQPPAELQPARALPPDARERLDRLVEGLLPAFAEPLRERRVELQVELPADLPEVRVDPMQMEQALLELVSNALDAMPRRRPAPARRPRR